MSVTKKDVLAVLEPDEPNYDAAKALGPDSLPHLRELVEGPDPMLASKAAYAASLLEGDQGRDVVAAAAHSDSTIVRVAAASAARNLPGEAAGEVLTELVADADQGVRKVARASIPAGAPAELQRLAEAPEAERSTAPGEQPGAGDVLQGGLMPGEEDAARSGRMPGEAGSGLMPGEEGGSADAGAQPGRMPGEGA